MPIVACPNPACATPCSLADDRTTQAVRCPRCGTAFRLAAPTPIRPAAANPTKVGKYSLREKLGAGAFGAVYRAFDPDLEREVAIKLLKPEALASPKAVERFQREARAMARLFHPHIVPVYEAGKQGDTYFLASAFIKGRTLAASIPDEGFAASQAVELTLQLLDALAYAHGQKVLHRDVKPANIMLEQESGRLYLMDFGLAGWVEPGPSRMTRLGAVMGTPSYMAPEQAAGRTNDVGPAADQYSAGVVLYELLTGHTPFDGPADTVIFNAIQTPPPSPTTLRADLDADLAALCLRSLAKKPVERFPDCAGFATALRAWLTTTVRPGITLAPTNRPTIQPTRPAAASKATLGLGAEPRKVRTNAAQRTTDALASRAATLHQTVPSPTLKRLRHSRSTLWTWLALSGLVLAGGGVGFLVFRDKITPTTNAAVADAPPLSREKPNNTTPIPPRVDTTPDGPGPVKVDPKPPVDPRPVPDPKPPRPDPPLDPKPVVEPVKPPVPLTPLEMLRRDADNGEVKAMWQLAEAYRTGELGLAKDETQSLAWIQRAAEKDWPEAQYLLGLYHAEGKGGEKNEGEAVKWWQRAAAQNHEPARQRLFDLLPLPTTPPSEAERLHRQAAEAGNPQSQFRLGMAYHRSLEGALNNYTAAAYWFRKAAKGGHQETHWHLAWLYWRGYGVARDLPEAVRLYTVASDAGFGMASLELGCMYRDGEGVKANATTAAELFNKAAIQGEPGGDYCLGNCYADGLGVAPDAQKAFAAWDRAKAKGHAEAKQVLANLPRTTTNFPPEAERVYRKAATDGDKEAQFQLAIAYLTGQRGVARNPTEGAKLLEAAAKLGHPWAQAELGLCYHNGIGVAADVKTAVVWYQKAANQKIHWAMRNLALIALQDPSFAITPEEAVKLLRPVADGGDALAQYHLGNCFAAGKGTERNPDEAIRLWKLSAAQGNPDARAALNSSKP